MSAIMLLSGGLDSSISLAKAVHEGYDICETIFFNYGQKSFYQERACAVSQWQAKHTGGDFTTLKIGDVFQGSASTILGLESSGRTSVALEFDAWLPNRNMVMLAIAAARAKIKGATEIIVGFTRDASKPDDSRNFTIEFEKLVCLATMSPIKIVTPVAGFDKRESVEWIVRNKIHFNWSAVWSCWNGNFNLQSGFVQQCGECVPCKNVKAAIEPYPEIVKKFRFAR